MAGTAGVDTGTDSSAPRPGPVVLLVDDEPEWIHWMSRSLREGGWVVVPASSGFAALAAYAQTLPDVVIADQKMPGMSGTEMAGVLRRRGFGGPMMLLSATIDSETNSACFRLGIHALSKLSHGAIFHTLDLFKRDLLAQCGAVPVEEVSAVSDPVEDRSDPPEPLGDEVRAPTARWGRWRQLLSVSPSPGRRAP